MSVRLVDDRSDGTIHIDKMQDGQLAEVTHWGTEGGPIGAIIQRRHSGLIVVGAKGDQCYPSFFDTTSSTGFRVRVLPNGTRLEVTDNE